MRRVVLIGVITAIFLSVGCALLGGGSPGLQRAEGYEVEPPPSWQTEAQGESDIAYRLPSGNVVTVTSSCNRNSDAPLEVLMRQLLIGSREVSITKTEPLQFGPQAAIHGSVSAKMDGVPFFMEVAVLRRHGCVFDFSLISPRSIRSDEEEVFVKFVKSFRFQKSKP